MLFANLTKPVAVFKCGELEESYPEAHKAFAEDFLCSMTLPDFAVDGKGSLWAFLGDDEVYLWQPPWKGEVTTMPGTWMDWSDLDDND